MKERKMNTKNFCVPVPRTRSSRATSWNTAGARTRNTTQLTNTSAARDAANQKTVTSGCFATRTTKSATATKKDSAG